MKTDKKENSHERSYLFYALLGSIVLGILWTLYYFTLHQYFQIFNGGYSVIQDDWGYFGDFFGGIVGTVVSLVAVVLVFLTYRLQRVELRETSQALNSQNEQLKIQQFENTFFKLLERKESLIRSLDYKGKNSFAALRSINKKFKRDNNQYDREETLKKFWVNRAILISLVNTFISTIEYLDNFMPESKSQELKKSQLVNIYTSNLSTYEKRTLKLIFEYLEKNEPDNEEVNRTRRIIEEWNIFDNKTSLV